MQITCANCGIPIAWQPTILDGRAFCCVGCAAGGPCTCDYSNLPHSGQVRAIHACYNIHTLSIASTEGLRGDETTPGQM